MDWKIFKREDRIEMLKKLGQLFSFTTKIFIVIMALLLTYNLVAASFYLIANPQLAKWDVRKIEQGESQVITWYDGLPLANVDSYKIIVVEKEQVSPKFYQAVIAIEDEDFYKHKGVNLTSVARAILYNMREVQYVQGGSTITQQLVKNMYLNPEKRMYRKIVELYLALRLESTYSKDDIIWMYVNQVYFGQNKYGIEQAAEHFYQKKASDLTREEAAWLAGILQAPSIYTNPNNRTIAAKRQEQVLERMP